LFESRPAHHFSRALVMNIEHLAINVPDPVAMAHWYTTHLGMRVVRAIDEPPHTRFLADRAGRVVLELYHQTAAAVPDYAAQHPFVLHIAFVAPDLELERNRLLAAGMLADGDIQANPAGDRLAFLRDPWGIVVQLVQRSRPLVSD